jgi:microcystin-dependent protein
MADFGEIASNQPKESFYLPPGIIMPYGGTATTAPSGWLFCNGASHGTATYPSLFAVIGTYYGGSGGSFLVPDLRRRFVLGFDNTASGTASVNKTGGDWDHVHSGPAHTHDLRNHTHTVGDHTHGMSDHVHNLPGLTSNARRISYATGSTQSAYFAEWNTLGYSAGMSGPTNNNTGFAGAGITGPPVGEGVSGNNITGPASYSGNTGAANPPYIVFKYIIKT